MSYELYTLAGSCSLAIHAVMNELGLNPKVHIMDKTEGENGIKSAVARRETEKILHRTLNRTSRCESALLLDGADLRPLLRGFFGADLW